jgi:ribosomal protein L11
MLNENQPLTDDVTVILKKASGDSDIREVLDGYMKLTGRLHIQVHGPDGKLKDERILENLVVTAGKAHVASILQNATGPAEMKWMAVGTGVTAPAAGDTDLQSEITTGLGGTRVSVTRTNPTSTSILYAATWNPGQATNGAITEAGTFNASAVGPASGTMLDRATFSAIAKAAGDTLTINWTVTVS